MNEIFRLGEEAPIKIFIFNKDASSLKLLIVYNNHSLIRPATLRLSSWQISYIITKKVEK